MNRKAIKTNQKNIDALDTWKWWEGTSKQLNP